MIFSFDCELGFPPFFHFFSFFFSFQSNGVTPSPFPVLSVEQKKEAIRAAQREIEEADEIVSSPPPIGAFFFSLFSDVHELLSLLYV